MRFIGHDLPIIRLFAEISTPPILKKVEFSVRHYLGSAGKKNRLEKIRPLVGAAPITIRPQKKSTPELIKAITGIDVTRCPKCQQGTLKKTNEFDGIYQRYRCHVFHPLT